MFPPKSPPAATFCDKYLLQLLYNTCNLLSRRFTVLSGIRLPSSARKGVVMKVRGFRGERWWVWVAMAVLASGIVILNILTAVLNHIMPRKAPLPSLISVTLSASSSHVKRLHLIPFAVWKLDRRCTPALAAALFKA